MGEERNKYTLPQKEALLTQSKRREKAIRTHYSYYGRKKKKVWMLDGGKREKKQRERGGVQSNEIKAAC